MGFPRPGWKDQRSLRHRPALLAYHQQVLRLHGDGGWSLHPARGHRFGEGGAGTLSDGKLYSQVKDPRHLGRKVLTEFVKAGAPEEIGRAHV